MPLTVSCWACTSQYATSATSLRAGHPLTFCFAKVSEPWSPRQERHLACISEFTTDARHIAGKDNCVADALSCTVIHSITAQLEIDYTEMAAAQ